MCTCVHAHTHACTRTCAYTCASLLWRSEGNLQEVALSPYHVGPGNLTQVVRLGSKQLYPLIILTAHRVRAQPRTWETLLLE